MSEQTEKKTASAGTRKRKTAGAPTKPRKKPAPDPEKVNATPEESDAAPTPEQMDAAPEESTAAHDPEPSADETNAADNAAGGDNNKNAGADHKSGDPDTADTATPEQAAHGWEVARVLKVTKPLIKGDDVKALQEALIAHNYHCGVTGADGIYAKNTAYAVRCFQSAHGLIVDGKAGRYTVAALGGVWKG